MMNYDYPQWADNGWKTEARKLMTEGGCDYNRAVDLVALRYLSAGNSRSFLDFMQQPEPMWAPGLDVRMYLAGMIDPEFKKRFSKGSFTYQIVFVGKQGRPRAEDITDGYLAVLKSGAAAMANGRQPGPVFWNLLWLLLAAFEDPEQFRSWHGRAPDVRAEIARIDGRKGRKSDPELETRSPGLVRRSAHPTWRRLLFRNRGHPGSH